MTLLRMIILLLGGLTVMLAVVALRAEVTRLHYEISQCERQAETLRQRLRAAEIKVAQLRSPMLIRARAEQILGELGDAAAPDPPKPPAPPGRRLRR